MLAYCYVYEQTACVFFWNTPKQYNVIFKHLHQWLPFIPKRRLVTFHNFNINFSNLSCFHLQMRAPWRPTGIPYLRSSSHYCVAPLLNCDCSHCLAWLSWLAHRTWWLTQSDLWWQNTLSEHSLAIGTQTSGRAHTILIIAHRDIDSTVHM